jgi:predicted nucleic acid-binding protein
MAAEGLDDPGRIAAALIKADGNVAKAARALGVKAAELRRLVTIEPALVDVALEAAELSLDRAEAELLNAMRVGALGGRLQAAAFVAKRRR